MNGFKVFIDKIDYSSYAVFPFNFGNLLDERLDEAYLTLVNTPKDVFKPLLDVQIILYDKNDEHNETEVIGRDKWVITPSGTAYKYTYIIETNYDFVAFKSMTVTGFVRPPELVINKNKITIMGISDDSTWTNEEVIIEYVGYYGVCKYFITANDNAHETPIGSGKYKHNLYIIERTKLLEGRICDSLTFTNTSGINYGDNKPAQFKGSASQIGAGGKLTLSYQNEVFKRAYSPQQFTFPTAEEVWNGIQDDGKKSFMSVYTYTIPGDIPITKYMYSQLTLVKKGDETIYSGNLSEEPTPVTITLEEGAIYDIRYDLFGVRDNALFTTWQYIIETTIICINNKLPLKKWTIPDVIDRVLELSKPILKGETSDYSLLASERTEYQKILAPEFTMTQCTLRDQLRVIGGYIHAEPRLNENNEIIFDDYGSEEHETITAPYVTKQTSIDINQYCTSVDTSASNIVNSLDYAQGVIYEPDSENYKSLRAQSINVRIEKNNAMATVPLPIYKIQKVMAGLIADDRQSWKIEPVDITAYVFDKTQYDSNLSSFEHVYPYSKAYALWYQQGGTSLNGFFFKPDVALFPEFQNYAIINIIKACSNETITLSSTNEPLIAVQIDYLPIYNTRFAHSKPYVLTDERSIVYNQSENLIETSYYGENIKGVVSRLGNVEKSLTLFLPNIESVPKVGRLYTLDGVDYYISAVSVEYEMNYIKCQIALSKDFNRLNQYIGIKSNKRVYEVSERQAYARNTLFRDKIVVGNKIPEETTFITDVALSNIIHSLEKKDDSVKLTTIFANGTEKDTTKKLNVVKLPVVSSAFGNVMTFSWAYKDNYSAGEQSIYKSNGNASGFWLQDYPYCNFYGRIYYYEWWLRSSGIYDDVSKQTENALIIPQNNFTNYKDSSIIKTGSPILLRKDSREILQCNYQIEFLANNRDIIIGSALASSCNLVSSKKDLLESDEYIHSIKFSETEIFDLKTTTTTPFTNESLLLYLGDNILDGDYIENGVIQPATLHAVGDSFIINTKTDTIQRENVLSDSVTAIYCKAFALPYKINKFKKQFIIDKSRPEFAQSGSIRITEKSASDNASIRVKLPQVSYEVKSWVLLTNQTVTTNKVQNDDGEESTEYTYNGGELLIGCNDPTTTKVYFSRKRR